MFAERAADPRSNAAALLVGRVVGATATILVLSIASHRLDGSQFGLVASTMAAGFLLNSLVTWGTDTVITRAVAADRPDAAETAGTSLGLQIVAVGVLVAIAAVAVGLGANVVVLVQALALLPQAAVTVGSAVLRGREQMGRLLVASASGALVALASILLLFAVDEAPWVPVAAMALGSLLTAVVLGALTAGGISAPNGRAAAELVRESGPFAAMVVLAAVGAQVGPIIVELVSEDTAGGYGVAVRLNEAARLLPASVTAAFFPAMLAGLHRSARYRRWMRLLTGYAVAATVALVALAGPINRIVFDSEAGAVPLIRILALGSVLTVVRLAKSFELIAAGRERAVLRSALIGAMITVAGGVALAVPAGSQGVAWAQLAGLAAATLSLALEHPADPAPRPADV